MRHLITVATLALLSVAGFAWAQGGSKPQNPAPTRPAPTANAPQAATTLVGCLYREDQIPGRTPNVAERAGVLEDYILADASPATKTGSATEAPATGAPTRTTGNMYKVEGPPDERLKALVGKKVEVAGRIDLEGGLGATSAKPQPDLGPGPDKINLPEFEATSIREVPGTCPATPAPRK